MTIEPPPAQWHERTLERSLRNARQRALTRGDRFIKAAADLLRTSGKSDFTLQEVVDHSGMSLRSFYHHFATKDDLLLAVIEEEMNRYISDLTPRIEATPGAAAKLELLLRESYGDRRQDDPASRGMVVHHWHLAEARTAEFAVTLQPQVALIESIISEGVADGTFSPDVPVDVQASLVTQAILTSLDLRVLGVELGRAPVTADHLVAWCLGALGHRAT